MKCPKEAKYKLGDIVIVYSEKDRQKVVQGKIVSAECFYDKGKSGTWFYAIEIPNVSGADESERIYSYEEDTGDATTKIFSPHHRAE